MRTGGMKRAAAGERKAAFLAAGIFSLLWIYIGALSLPQGRVHDFQYSYGAGRLILDGRTAGLYGSSLDAGPHHHLPYDRPAAAALLDVPFGLLPPDTAFACYTALWVALLLICWAWGYRNFGPWALVMAAMFIPATLGLAHAQDCVLYLALAIWSYSLARRERDVAAGTVLGLMVLKFHLVLLWPLALILRRRWKMLAGFLATSSVLAVISVLMVGISGSRDYIALLLKPSPVSPSPEFMLSFSGLLVNLGIHSVGAGVVLAAAILGLFVLGVRQAPLPHLYAITTAASLTLIPHAYGYDAARLLLPIWLVYHYSEWRVARTAAVLMATPFVYCFTLFGRPWAAVGSAAALTFFTLLAIETFHTRRAVKVRNAPPLENCPAP